MAKGEIKVLKDNELLNGTDETPVYPVTHANAVYGLKNGKSRRLDKMLKDIDVAIVNIQNNSVKLEQTTGGSSSAGMSQNAITQALLSAIENHINTYHNNDYGTWIAKFTMNAMWEDSSEYKGSDLKLIYNNTTVNIGSTSNVVVYSKTMTNALSISVNEFKEDLCVLPSKDGYNISISSITSNWVAVKDEAPTPITVKLKAIRNTSQKWTTTMNYTFENIPEAYKNNKTPIGNTLTKEVDSSISHYIWYTELPTPELNQGYDGKWVSDTQGMTSQVSTLANWKYVITEKPVNEETWVSQCIYSYFSSNAGDRYAYPSGKFPDPAIRRKEGLKKGEFYTWDYPTDESLYPALTTAYKKGEWVADDKAGVTTFNSPQTTWRYVPVKRSEDEMVWKSSVVAVYLGDSSAYANGKPDTIRKSQYVERGQSYTWSKEKVGITDNVTLNENYIGRWIASDSNAIGLTTESDNTVTWSFKAIYNDPGNWDTDPTVKITASFTYGDNPDSATVNFDDIMIKTGSAYNKYFDRPKKGEAVTYTVKAPTIDAVDGYEFSAKVYKDGVDITGQTITLDETNSIANIEIRITSTVTTWESTCIIKYDDSDATLYKNNIVPKDLKYTDTVIKGKYKTWTHPANPELANGVSGGTWNVISGNASGKTSEDSPSVIWMFTPNAKEDTTLQYKVYLNTPISASSDTLEGARIGFTYSGQQAYINNTGVPEKILLDSGVLNKGDNKIINYSDYNIIIPSEFKKDGVTYTLNHSVDNTSKAVGGSSNISEIEFNVTITAKKKIFATSITITYEGSDGYVLKPNDKIETGTLVSGNTKTYKISDIVPQLSPELKEFYKGIWKFNGVEINTTESIIISENNLTPELTYSITYEPDVWTATYNLVYTGDADLYKNSIKPTNVIKTAKTTETSYSWGFPIDTDILADDVEEGKWFNTTGNTVSTRSNPIVTYTFYPGARKKIEYANKWQSTIQVIYPFQWEYGNTEYKNGSTVIADGFIPNITRYDILDEDKIKIVRLKDAINGTPILGRNKVGYWYKDGELITNPDSYMFEMSQEDPIVALQYAVFGSNDNNISNVYAFSVWLDFVISPNSDFPESLGNGFDTTGKTNFTVKYLRREHANFTGLDEFDSNLYTKKIVEANAFKAINKNEVPFSYFKIETLGYTSTTNKLNFDSLRNGSDIFIPKVFNWKNNSYLVTWTDNVTEAGGRIEFADGARNDSVSARKKEFHYKYTFTLKDKGNMFDTLSPYGYIEYTTNGGQIYVSDGDDNLYEDDEYENAIDFKRNMHKRNTTSGLSNINSFGFGRLVWVDKNNSQVGIGDVWDFYDTSMYSDNKHIYIKNLDGTDFIKNFKSIFSAYNEIQTQEKQDHLFLNDEKNPNGENLKTVKVNLGSFTPSDMGLMFDDCYSLESVVFESRNKIPSCKLEAAFRGTAIKSIDLSNFEYPISLNLTLSSCKNLEEIDMSNWSLDQLFGANGEYKAIDNTYIRFFGVTVKGENNNRDWFDTVNCGYNPNFKKLIINKNLVNTTVVNYINNTKESAIDRLIVLLSLYVAPTKDPWIYWKKVWDNNTNYYKGFTCTEVGDTYVFEKKETGWSYSPNSGEFKDV